MPLPAPVREKILAALDDLPRPKHLCGKVRFEVELNYNPEGQIGTVKQIQPIEQELR